MINFYIDENNKFAIKTIRPRALVNPTSIATYREGLQILSGFEFSRETESAKAGFRIFYDFVGEGQGAFNNGYAKKYEVQYQNAIPGITQWDEVQSKWIFSDEDAKFIAWRHRTHTERGIDRVTIPTTLYGIIHNMSDLIRVTHRTGSLTNALFEIDQYQKDFRNNSVELSAFSVERLYGYGNCRWSGTAGSVDSSSESGYSVYGPIGSLTNFGSITGTLGANDSIFQVYNVAAWYPYQGRFLVFGSRANGYSEIMYLKGLIGVGPATGLAIVERGVFNSISRCYFDGEKVYDGGIPSRTILGQLSPARITETTWRTATTIGINSNLGSSFKFF